MKKFEIVLSNTNTLKDVYLIEVSGDTNDADYVSKTTKIPSNQIKKWLPAIYLIQKGEIDGWGEYRGRNHHSTPDFDDDIEDLLSELIPYGEYGVHSVSLKSFRYYDTDGKVHLASIKEIK